MPPILKLMDQQLPQTTLIDPGIKKKPSAVIPKKMILAVGILLLLIVILGAAYFLKAKPKPQEEPQVPPVSSHGASFILNASPTEATLGGQIKVSVLVKSDNDSANLFVAKLKFPNNILQAKSIDLRSEATASGFIKNWFISNWVENTIDNETGSVSLVGGVPNPGFQSQPESSGSAMADVIFTPKSPGEATISFNDTSTIYRNSDNANILSSKTGVTIKILGETPIASPSSTVTPTIEVLPSPTLTPTPIGSLEGDVNQDTKVDLQDLSVLLSAWGSQGQGTLKADMNQDGVVNVFDYSKLTKILRDVGLLP